VQRLNGLSDDPLLDGRLCSRGERRDGSLDGSYDRFVARGEKQGAGFIGQDPQLGSRAPGKPSLERSQKSRRLTLDKERPSAGSVVVDEVSAQLQGWRSGGVLSGVPQ